MLNFRSLDVQLHLVDVHDILNECKIKQYVDLMQKKHISY